MTITINEILYAIITVVLPLALKLAYQYVSMKVDNTQYESAVDAIYSAVEYVNQTFVDSLKQSGCFDKEAQEQAFIKAKEAALETMEANTRKWLEKSFVNMDEWLTVQIESAVKGVK